MAKSIQDVNNFFSSSNFFYSISIDLDSRYNSVNDNYDKNFSFGKGTLLGQHFSITLHPEDIHLCSMQGQKCFENPGQLIPVTLRKHDGKGGYVTTNWEMQAMLDDQNNPLGIYCVGYNITELVKTQNKLETAHMKLDEIGFIQSHVVRKPLANIMGLAGLLRSETGDREELLKMLLETADELDQVIRNISDKTYNI
jgi:PAS domain S-box-containing protein